MNEVENLSSSRNDGNTMLAAVYYKCVGTNYSTFIKGQIYHRDTIGKYLQEYPKDWKKVLPYPTTQELLAAFEKNERVSQVIRALKQWSNCS